jgi:hypothetical protein
MSEGKRYVGAVISVYTDCEQAQGAFEKVKQAGFSADDLSLVGSEEDVRQAQRGYSYPPSDVLRGETRRGAVLGAEVGAATGLLTGLATFLFPEMGMFAALGPLAGLLGGAGVGAAFGGPLGEVDYQDNAAEYRELLIAGNLLLVVHCATTDEERKASKILGAAVIRIVPYVE